VRMKFTRKQTLLFLALSAVFFGFSLLNASWTAAVPVGGPKLIAGGPADLPTDAKGCIIDPQVGFGATLPAVDIRMLQAAVGLGAAAVNITLDASGEGAAIARNYKSACAADTARPRAMLAEAVPALSNAEIYLQISNAADAAAIMNAVPVGSKAVYYGSDAATAAMQKARPTVAAFSITKAQACVSDYKASGWTGRIPRTCKGGAAIVIMDQIGYTLWGWPNRFLARMEAAGIRVIIAQDVRDGKIIGLTNAEQYGEIANTYNGFIWVDNIAELGPALKR
jgi:glycerophosphoryl diester phosphodiesterase